MKKFVTTLLMGVVLSLGAFASMASAGNGNGNGGMDKGGTNTCQPGFHDAGGTCVHNGDGGGNCGQNQSGDTGNGRRRRPKWASIIWQASPVRAAALVASGRCEGAERR